MGNKAESADSDGSLLGSFSTRARVRQRGKVMIQDAKHKAFIATRKSTEISRRGRDELANRLNPKLVELAPYHFDPTRYRRSFLVRPSPEDTYPSEMPQRVLCCWTGDSELTPNRRRSLEALESTLDVEVSLVTPDTLDGWIVPDAPLHWAYEYLSLVHRSDYLRAYLMHHYGGGYVDIKEPLGSWQLPFANLEAHPDKWLLGYREIGVSAVTRAPGKLGRDLRRNYNQLIGCCAMIARSHTPFTAEWLREVERRMDYYAPQLVEFPGGTRGEVVGYPISWTRLLGRIFHPLSLKYLDRLLIDDRVKVSFENYQ